MPITRDDLQALKVKSDEAKRAFHTHKSDGTLDADIRERILLHASSEAESTYKDTISKYLKGDKS